MAVLLAALGIQLAGGLAALLAGRRATLLGVGGVVLGSAVAFVPALQVLLGAPALALELPWDVPFGAFAVGLDPLSAFFLLPVLALSAVAAVYGGEYVRAHDHAAGTSWLFYAVLVTSMELVLLARNAVLFLVAWEVMALASFFLVTTDDEDANVREAGWTYLVATHLGTACLLAMFVLLAHGADPMSFAAFSRPSNASVLFLLALAGFGAKAGLVPLHVWLPEAHPAAPSHVSALMSGAMLKTGIYGLVRVLVLLGPLPAWCGWLLVAVGGASAFLGILSALGQGDLKRLLAYSSVENMGLVALALGMGLVGLDAGATDVAALGFAAALFHVAGHAIIKGGLFLVAGTVLAQTGSRRLDALGGLLERLPRTGLACFVGCAAIAGLPPMAGFATELLLFLAAYRALFVAGVASPLVALVTIGGLGLIGGLAAACFTKTFGTAFLGTPRGGREAREPGVAMQGAVLVLAAGCVALGAAAPLVVGSLEPVLAQVTGLSGATLHDALAPAIAALWAILGSCGVVALLAAALAALRRRLLAGRVVTTGPAWDCGYAAPSSRMQYTAASFAQPLMAVFARVLPARTDVVPPTGLFPARASFATETPDAGRDWLYRPLFQGVGRALASVRWIQRGEVQLYVLYIALTLVGLLLWTIGTR